MVYVVCGVSAEQRVQDILLPVRNVEELGLSIAVVSTLPPVVLETVSRKHDGITNTNPCTT
jgi:hypothetical protein